MKNVNKLKTIIEARPDKNIYYYLNDFQYGIFERTMDNWNTALLGKFSIQKCFDFLEDLGEEYEINAEEWNFRNIKKEEKLNKKTSGIAPEIHWLIGY